MRGFRKAARLARAASKFRGGKGSSPAATTGALLSVRKAVANCKPFEIVVKHAKLQYSVQCSQNDTFADLKRKLVELSGLAVEEQKIAFKGARQDNETLRSAGAKAGSKMMLLRAKRKATVTASAPPATPSNPGHPKVPPQIPSLLSPRTQKVQKIDAVAKEVTDLVRQYEELAAVNVSPEDKAPRGLQWKRAMMLQEQLTKVLLKLDGVLSEGDQQIRTLRKAQVRRCMELGDEKLAPLIKKLE